MKTVLLTRLPYDSSERLALIWHTLATKGTGVVGMSPHDYGLYRESSRSFESVAAITTRGA